MKSVMGRLFRQLAALRAPQADRVVARNARYATTERAAMLLAKLLALLALARVLGPQGYGQYAVLIATLTVASVCSLLGGHVAATYFAAKEGAGQAGRATYVAALLFTCFSAAIGAIGVSIVLRILPLGIPLPPSGTLMLAVGVAINNGWWVFGAYCQGLGLFRQHLLGVLVQQGLFLGVVSFGLFGQKLTASLAFGGWVAGLACASAYWMVVAWKGADGAVAGSFYWLSRFIAYGSRGFMFHAGQQVAVRVDMLVVGALVGQRELGWYAIACAATEMVLYAAYLIGPVLLEHSARTGLVDARTVRLAFFALMSGYIALALVAPVAVPLVLGSSYRPAVSLMVILSLGYLGLGVGLVAASPLLGLGRQRLVGYGGLGLGAGVSAVAYATASWTGNVLLVAASVSSVYLVYGACLVVSLSRGGAVSIRRLTIGSSVNTSG